jgi:hypothetical protein
MNPINKVNARMSSHTRIPFSVKAALDDIMLVQKLNQGWSHAGCPWLACCTMSIMSSGPSQKTFMRPFKSQTNPKATLNSVISVVLLFAHLLALVFLTKTITGYASHML